MFLSHLDSEFIRTHSIQHYQELEISLYTFVSSSIEELTVKDESSGVPSFSSLLNESFDVEQAQRKILYQSHQQMGYF